MRRNSGRDAAARSPAPRPPRQRVVGPAACRTGRAGGSAATAAAPSGIARRGRCAGASTRRPYSRQNSVQAARFAESISGLLAPAGFRRYCGIPVQICAEGRIRRSWRRTRRGPAPTAAPPPDPRIRERILFRTHPGIPAHGRIPAQAASGRSRVRRGAGRPARPVRAGRLPAPAPPSPTRRRAPGSGADPAARSAEPHRTASGAPPPHQALGERPTAEAPPRPCDGATAGRRPVPCRPGRGSGSAGTRPSTAVPHPRGPGSAWRFDLPRCPTPSRSDSSPGPGRPPPPRYHGRARRAPGRVRPDPPGAVQGEIYDCKLRLTIAGRYPAGRGSVEWIPVAGNGSTEAVPAVTGGARCSLARGAAVGRAEAAGDAASGGRGLR